MLEHKDLAFITLLKSDGPGLQVKYLNGWKNIKYCKNKFIINYGSLLQYSSNNLCKASWHRVPSVFNFQRAAIGLFCGPDMIANVYKLNNTNAKFEKILNISMFINII